jgi:hypothetical protein
MGSADITISFREMIVETSTDRTMWAPAMDRHTGRHTIRGESTTRHTAHRDPLHAARGALCAAAPSPARNEYYWTLAELEAWVRGGNTGVP